MKKMAKYLLLFLCAFSVSTGKTQVYLWGEATGGVVDDTLKVEIKVSGFETMAYFQFSLNWDPALVQFVRLHALNTQLPLPIGNFNIELATDGALNTVWFGPMGTGQSLPDSAVLFGMDFPVVGDIGAISSILFSDDPTPMIFGHPDGQTNVIARDIEIEVISSIPLRPFINHLLVYPNPTPDRLTIDVELLQPESVEIAIMDVSGKIIVRSQYDLVTVKKQLADLEIVIS